MSNFCATAIAHPNIAFIKYWGNKDEFLRIPLNSSLSMNLDTLFTRTQVEFDPRIHSDSLIINREQCYGPSFDRLSKFLDILREKSKKEIYAKVISENNFPTAAGIASSASAFAALTLAAVNALELDLSEKELSQLARRGSGSASRSIPEGFVEWQAGNNDQDSFSFSIAPPSHWDLVDCITIVQSIPKRVSSTEGHRLANTSILQEIRVKDSNRRLEICKKAIINKDFEKFAQIIELDSNLMHAVMMTSQPPLFYWEPISLEIMCAVTDWRSQGIPVCYTIDAGPNIHVICTSGLAEKIKLDLLKIDGVIDVLLSGVGSGAQLVLSK